MKLIDIPSEVVSWQEVPGAEHPGETGVAIWRERVFGEIRVRMVEYSSGYSADHWCEKGHLLLCLSGELEIELMGGRTITISAGSGYYVADGLDPHRSKTAKGATLYVVD